MGVIYLGILLCSIAFAGIVAYICLVLKRISTTMQTLGTTLGEVEKELESITPEIKETVQHTGNLVDDVSDKVNATDSVFDTLENIGNSANAVNDVYHHNREKLSDEQFQRKVTPFIEGIRWTEAAFLLYSKWKKQQSSEEPINQTGSRDDI